MNASSHIRLLHQGFDAWCMCRYGGPDIKVKSDATFYTDANGREMLRRVRDERPTWNLNVTQPVAGNYYPVTSAAFIEVCKS